MATTIYSISANINDAHTVQSGVFPEQIPISTVYIVECKVRGLVTFDNSRVEDMTKGCVLHTTRDIRGYHNNGIYANLMVCDGIDDNGNVFFLLKINSTKYARIETCPVKDITHLLNDNNRIHFTISEWELSKIVRKTNALLADHSDITYFIPSL